MFIILRILISHSYSTVFREQNCFSDHEKNMLLNEKKKFQVCKCHESDYTSRFQRNRRIILFLLTCFDIVLSRRSKETRF